MGDVPEDTDYYIRVSASSGEAAHELDLTIDGKRASFETYDVLDTNERLTRDVYDPPAISWYPGWHMRLSKGKHTLVFTVPDSKPTPALLLDAIALQSYKELPDPRCSFRKSEIGRKSGSFPAANTRKPTSSLNFFCIRREENTPTQ